MKGTQTHIPLLPCTHMNENNLFYHVFKKPDKAAILWLLATDYY